MSTVSPRNKVTKERRAHSQYRSHLRSRVESALRDNLVPTLFIKRSSGLAIREVQKSKSGCIIRRRSAKTDVRFLIGEMFLGKEAGH